MNKHLLEQRLRSLNHYDSEIKKLEATIETVKSTRRELQSSLIEFFPFQVGDVIIQIDSKTVFKINKIQSSDYYPEYGGLRFHVEIEYQNGRWGMDGKGYITSTCILFKNINNYKKIFGND